MRGIKERMTGLLALPKEIALDLPVVMATGRGEVNVENYKSILEFTDERIKVNTKDGAMTIEGERLKLRQVTTENVLISGRITGIKYS
ncbi:MAG: sporulation protein YqfC [Defluviitaleaceae bacterium]|nr:sporulation protein YqfC [Defluviitaleaceae bacterium]